MSSERKKHCLIVAKRFLMRVNSVQRCWDFTSLTDQLSHFIYHTFLRNKKENKYMIILLLFNIIECKFPRKKSSLQSHGMVKLLQTCFSASLSLIVLWSTFFVNPTFIENRCQYHSKFNSTGKKKGFNNVKENQQINMQINISIKHLHTTSSVMTFAPFSHPVKAFLSLMYDQIRTLK